MTNLTKWLQWLKDVTKTVNMVNFGRSLQSSDLSCYNEIINYPIGKSFNEKVFCIVNDITEPLFSPIDNKPYRFVNFYEGYVIPNYSKQSYDSFINRLLNDDIELLTNTDRELLVNPLYAENHRNLLQDNIGLYQKVFTNSKFLPSSATFPERLYCLVNNINHYDNTKRFENAQIGYVDYYDAIYKNKVDSEINELKKLFPSYSITILEEMVFKIRRISNKNIYLNDLPDDLNNIEFVVCPLLGIRLKTINKSYIEKVSQQFVEQIK